MGSEVAATTRRETEAPATYIGLKTRARTLKLNNGSVSASSQQQGSTEIKKKKKESHKPTVDKKYSQWKTLVPILYDSLSNHSLVWPCLSCRWGPQFEQASSKNQQRLYLTEQTDGNVPNTLVVANCEAVKKQLNREACSPLVKKYKTIIHPGEVNRIRELPQNSKIVATHTDSPDVLIWDTETQPDRHAVVGAPHSRPDLILTGHQDNAEFALAMFPTEPFVLSGGKDKLVILWSIEDQITAAGTDSKSHGSSIKQSGEDSSKTGGRSVGPRGVYHGHEDTVEDVAFCPSSAQEFCSVGDDSCLILWDARTGTCPAMKVEKAHDADLHCVDWNPHDNNLILTGSADNTVRLFDRRNLTSNGVGSPIYKFEGHKASVLSVQWSPDKLSVFGSSAEDGLLNIWDYDRVGKKSARAPKSPAGLFFQHAGHRDNVVDFHWNVLEPWTIASVSGNCESNGGGGSCQIWRMSDLIYRPEDEVLTELENFKSQVFSCASRH
ncbi:WD-40 repeat-containing protein MSI5-like isoform X2 [Raphanus sativus]|uniref:WD-40 repeat-containing protein MSI5 isoform X2 n=1 Tax=Raphanus sativus TaxID=3726 RepID=A0A6J0MIG8_RAPSA|nr:WD-40 repeat-containing protein MSI5 isoform X2 [Raphanus sativus]XP_056857072.1 WD-40 repeat-containing protein MSI5-like isoform X2 [Raphanus sativus]